jgi:hypothetical protein
MFVDYLVWTSWIEFALLILLPVFAGFLEAINCFQFCAVVLFSVVLLAVH